MLIVCKNMFIFADVNNKTKRLCQRGRESIFDLIMMNGEEALTAVQANLPLDLWSLATAGTQEFASREYKNL
jgi:hypothetical protein